jgi:hypothetical protein
VEKECLSIIVILNMGGWEFLSIIVILNMVGWERLSSDVILNMGDENAYLLL